MHPDHQEVIGSLRELCTKSVRCTKTQLDDQKVSDEAEAKQMEEDRKRIDAMARLAAEREAKEKADVLQRILEEEEAIKATECELHLKKQALRNVQKVAEIPPEDKDDEDDEDVASISTVGDRVSHL